MNPDEPSTIPDDAQPQRLLSKRQIVLQLIGFSIGLVLLIWIIRDAIQQGDWSRLRDAKPELIVGLLACTAVSYAANGAAFWLMIRSVKNVGLGNMQLLNLSTGVLNYAPIRLGMVARIVYNLRVDQLSVLQVGAWFASVTATILLALVACIVATVVHDRFDWIWGAIVIAQLIAGGLILSATAGMPLVVRHGRGIHQMLGDSTALWGCIGFRLIDIAAFAGRMACAVAIIGLDLSTSDVLLLAFLTLAVSLNPLGKVGFREAAVAWVAPRLVSTDLSGEASEEFNRHFDQLALIESAGEAAFVIPLGALALIWYWRRWTAAKRRTDAQESSELQEMTTGDA